ncbi:MAG: SDR family oxidoreductase [Cyclobacteriaceae bacterium]|nr:SDR family oxidoreductase [Cyclobacteriaceae bacterium]
MDLHLKNKVFLVSGGAKGIGKAVCLQLLEEGAVPVILDKDETAGKAFTKEFPRAHFIAIDLNDEFACKKAIDKADKTLGHIDGLVNNAGGNDSVGLEKGTPQKFLQSLTNNIGHYYFLAHHILSYLKKSHGSIVNVSSKVALAGQGNTSGYAAAKGGIMALTREWAAELSPFSIRVNAVVPAEVWTPMYETWLKSFPDPLNKKLQIESKIPLGNRMTTPEEIANMIVFLLSDRCSHVTGQWISPDGGYVHLDRSL